MKTFALLSLLLVQSVFGDTPSEALGVFKKAAQAKNFEEAWKHVVKFDGVPDQVTQQLKTEIKLLVAYLGRE